MRLEALFWSLALCIAGVSADRAIYVGTYTNNAFVYAQNGTLLQTVAGLASPSWLEYNAAKRLVLAGTGVEFYASSNKSASQQMRLKLGA